MTVTSTRFQKAKAPCGRILDGEHFQDQDEQCLVTDERCFDCGCRVIQHEYHDGSFCRRVVRHDGKILADEHHDEHQA